MRENREAFTSICPIRMLCGTGSQEIFCEEVSLAERPEILAREVQVLRVKESQKKLDFGVNGGASGLTKANMSDRVT